MKLHDVTTQSIKAALDHMHAERAKVEAATGLRIVDEPAPAFVMGCPRPGCRYAATARNEGRATRALSAHLVHHMKRGA